jgi:putative hemolysin
MLLPVLILLGLLLLCSFFAGIELALMTLDRVGMETDARKGSALARMQLKLRERPQRFLSTILVGYNVSNVALNLYAAKVSHELALASGFDPERALLISGIVLTVGITIFGELLPKAFAAVNPRGFAKFGTLPLYYLNWLLTPLTAALDGIVNPFLRLLSGGKPSRDQVMGREELETAIRMARAGGLLHSVDSSVASEALDFSQKDLRDVMTPRVDVIAIADTATLGEALMLMSQYGFTRLPVFHEDMDEIVGALLLKDIVRESTKAAQSGRDPFDEWAASALTPLMREVRHFPDSKSIVEALNELRQDRAHLAIVVDEHGGTAGIVTLEDILEELVGDIRDEYDSEQSVDVLRRTSEYAIVSARARLDQLPELEELELEDVEAGTIGGLMMEKLGRRVIAGDELLLPSEQEPQLRITALQVVGNRIKLLKLERLGGAEQSDTK